MRETAIFAENGAVGEAQIVSQPSQPALDSKHSLNKSEIKSLTSSLVSQEQNQQTP